MNGQRFFCTGFFIFLATSVYAMDKDIIGNNDLVKRDITVLSQMVVIPKKKKSFEWFFCRSVTRPVSSIFRLKKGTKKKSEKKEFSFGKDLCIEVDDFNFKWSKSFSSYVQRVGVKKFLKKNLEKSCYQTAESSKLFFLTLKKVVPLKTFNRGNEQPGIRIDVEPFVDSDFLSEGDCLIKQNEIGKKFAENREKNMPVYFAKKQFPIKFSFEAFEKLIKKKEGRKERKRRMSVDSKKRYLYKQNFEEGFVYFGRLVVGQIKV